jgi:hypothetical protein
VVRSTIPILHAEYFLRYSLPRQWSGGTRWNILARWGVVESMAMRLVPAWIAAIALGAALAACGSGGGGPIELYNLALVSSITGAR